MAKLKVLPHQAIIDGFKGTLDLYVHDGVPCARRWPRSPGRRRAAAVEAQWPRFAYASREWTNLDDETQDRFRTMAQGTGLSGRDLFTRAFIKGIFTYPSGGEEEMQTFWMPDPDDILPYALHNVSVPWTVIDLSSSLPADTQFALIQMLGHKSNQAGAGRIYLRIRPKDIVYSHYPFISWLSNNVALNDVHLFATCPVSSDRKIEWKLDNAQNCNIRCALYLFGYIK